LFALKDRFWEIAWTHPDMSAELAIFFRVDFGLAKRRELEIAAFSFWFAPTGSRADT
jgi:hypothetical protein